MGGRNSIEIHRSGTAATPPKPTKELNILILGETGVGKSTWINGIRNYLEYSTLAEAESNEFLAMIPMYFTMSTMDYEEIVVSTGHDNNEDATAGNSATQWPQTYTHVRGDTLIRLVDTPGMGDVRGVEQDKENFKRIISHLSTLKEIHGICILLKPNNARLTVAFQFCIKELLTHLHVDAGKNIVFCFTNTRSTFYRPGDTLAPLKTLLGANTNVSIPINRSTIYCMDNEAVRFLAAAKQGIQFDDADRKNFCVSWEKSVQETDRLLNYVSTCEAHKTSSTIALNRSRRLITELTKPLAEISKNVQDSMAVVRDQEEEMKNIDVARDNLTKKLRVPAIELKIEQLNYPQTVCGNSKCMEYVQDKYGRKQAVYKQPCHEYCNCGITVIFKGTKNQTELQKCHVMYRISGQVVCKVCGCPWFEHLHPTHRVTKVNTTIEDPNVKTKLKALLDQRDAIAGFVQQIRSRNFQLQEVEFATNVSAELAAYLRRNAIMPYNDAMAEYLDHLICVEKSKVAVNGNKKEIEALMNMKSHHAKEVEILKEAMNKNDASLADSSTPLKMKELFNKLYALPINGPKFKPMVRVVDDARNAMNPQMNTFDITAAPPPLPRPTKEVNTVILGEARVGKSTWINGVLNYLAYPTLEVAEQNEFLNVIHMSFTMTSMDYEEIVVSTGKDSKAENTATQCPRTYYFVRDDTLFRLINTPGIGDVRGREQDKENFDRILSHLSNLNEIHGICILLKPNDSRLSSVLHFYLEDLLTHLHMDAGRNIVFCFTNARSTFYRPGTTVVPLKKYLKARKNVNIPVSWGTMFCIDNEAVRYLAAVKQGVKFEKDDRENVSRSWDKSVDETARLFNYISGLRPHRTSDTISLNHSRRMIAELTKPMADISKNIRDNIAAVRDEKKKLDAVYASWDDLIKTDRLKFKIFDERFLTTIQQLEQEQEFITKVSAEFVVFLRKYAITPHNDVVAEYLDHLFRVEKDNVTVGGVKKSLESPVGRHQYEEEVKILKKALEEKSPAADRITPQRVQELIQQLFRLPVHGPKLKSMMQVVSDAS